MKNLNTLLCVFSLIIATDNVLAQKKTAAWTATVKNPVNWQRVHSLGYIIVSTNAGLYAVNPTDGKILWENGFAALEASSFAEVPGTEFATISYKQDADSKIPMQAVVDVVTGKVLFDSQKEKIGVLSRHVLAASGRLLIIGVRQDGKLNTSLFMYDIASGAPIWSNEELFKPDAPAGKGFFNKLQALGTQLGNLQSLTSEPVELGDQTMIITHPTVVFRINSADGKVIWKQPILASKKAQVHFSSYRKDKVFVGIEVESSSGSGFSSGNQGQPNKFYYNYYYSFDLATGAPTWKEPGKESDMLNRVIVHEKGLIICPRSSQKPTINLVDYETGQTLWGNKGKGIKAQGSVVNYIPTEKGYLITTAHEGAWNDGAEEYFLNILDPSTGTLRYEKSVKLKGDLVRTELVPKGLIFLTTREANILDVATGTLLWPESIEAGKPITDNKARPFPSGTSPDGKVYVYSPKEAAVLEVDKQAGTYRKITSTKIEFQGKELPKLIDVKADGIILSSDQNIMKIGFDGAIKYAKYYPAPRESGLMRALYAAQAIRAAYIGAAATQASVAFAQAGAKSTDPVGKELGGALSKGYAQLGEAGFAYSNRCMKEFSARYKASQNSPDFVIMMTPAEKKGHRLIQVSKATGEIQASIDINNDKEPEYEVDQIYNFIYYRPTPNDIVCYKL
jgi:outer membrane protein assembly factor BamB